MLSQPGTPSRALGLVFAFFLALGLLFLAPLVRELIDAAATYTWQTVPCQIVESEVRESSDSSPWLSFLRYTWETGESQRSSRAFRTYRDALRLTRRWPAGSRAICYLDPREPAGALLERKVPTLILAIFIPLPLLFVFVGAAGFYSVVFRKVLPRRETRPAHPAAGRRIVAALMIVVGTGLSLAFLLGPVRHVLAARSWLTRECRMLRSEVRVQADSEGGDTYSPVILYSYLFNQREYRCDTYSFFEFSAGRSAAQRIADRYRPGSIATCYVNPADPDDATIHREPSPAWLIGLLPLALLTGGLAAWPRPTKPLGEGK